MKKNNELVLRVHGPGGKRVSRSHEAATLAQVWPYNNSEHDAAFSPTPPPHCPQLSASSFTLELHVLFPPGAPYLESPSNLRHLSL